MKKKLLTMLAVIVLGMALVCGVNADEMDDWYYNDFYSGLTWLYDKPTETLTFSGKGYLPTYLQFFDEDMGFTIRNVVMENGVTALGSASYGWLGSDVTSITLPTTLKEIRASVFCYCGKLTDVYYAGSESDWKRINIGVDNEFLFKATIHYNYKPETEKTISVLVNSAPVVFPDQQPILKDERTLVPARGVFEALGATVTWDEATKTVTILRGDTRVTLTIGQSYIIVNGEQKAQDVPAQLINERTMIPVRAVAEAFGCDVGWDGDTYTVSISM